MSRSCKSQRKLDRKTRFSESYFNQTSAATYGGYFGELLELLDSDFQNNHQRIKHWLGKELADSIEEWHLTPQGPLSAKEIFLRIQGHVNKDCWGSVITDPLHQRLLDSEYTAFRGVSERLKFGYVAYAEYYLRKEQREDLDRDSGARYHSGYHVPVTLFYLNDYSLYG